MVTPALGQTVASERTAVADAAAAGGGAPVSGDAARGQQALVDGLRALGEAVAQLTRAIAALTSNGSSNGIVPSGSDRTLGTAPVSAPTSAGTSAASGSTYWKPGQLHVGINWEGLDEIGGSGKVPAFVRKFDDFNSKGINAQEKQLVAQGATLYKSLKPISRSTGEVHSWSDIASGKHDAFLAGYLQNLKAEGGKNVIFAFNHEPDGKQNLDKGTPEQFVAAWRHIHDLADRLGVSRSSGGNVEFAWTMVGWGFTIDRVGAYYPGDRYVDYVGTDPYDNAKAGKPRQSFADSTLPTIDWMRRNGIDKPVIVSETGTDAGAKTGSGSQAQWIDQMMRDLQTNPALDRVVGVGYWSNQVAKSGSRNYVLDDAAARTYASYM
jgi:hypothetical protein